MLAHPPILKQMQALEEERTGAGDRLNLREFVTFAGPAFVASIAYIDPGNFASNIAGGAQFGYSLLWVLLWSNAMAILVQYLSAKMGIATGKTLPQNCREHFSRPVVWLLWAAAEVGAIATDLAEFLGAAVGVYLLAGPALLAHGYSRNAVMLLAALATTLFVFLLLALNQRGFRGFERIIIVMVGVIGGCYGLEVFLAHPDWPVAAQSVLLPRLSRQSVYIAVTMLGATVMPHVIYLHSALVLPRTEREGAAALPAYRRRFLRYERIDIIAAMNGAWIINSAMLIMAAAAMRGADANTIGTFEGAHQTLGPLLGPGAQVAFAVALLCSGLSSSTVGVLAGQVVIEGFLAVNFPIYLRRIITIVPAVAIIALGVDELKVMLFSQAVLSFCIPFALVPLLVLTGREGVMRGFGNLPRTALAGWLVTALILALNGALLWQVFTGGNT